MEWILLSLVVGIIIGSGSYQFMNRREAPTSRQIFLIRQLREERDVRAISFGEPGTRAEASKIIDVLLAFPFLLLVILMVAVLGTDIRNAMIALMIGGTPGTARTLRSLVLSIKQRPFVEAAEVSGLGGWRIIQYEIFPNVLPLAVALMTIQMSWMIVAIAGLSFLGLGVRPPDADWGTLIAEARGHIFRAPYLALIPSVLVALVSFVFFVLGDALQRTLGEERVR